MCKFSSLALSAALGCGLVFGAAPASALKIESFDVSSMNSDGPNRPQIHVTFDLQADNWNAVTSDSVRFKFYYSITLYKTYALSDGSHISIGLEDLSWTHELHSLKSGNEVFEGDIDLAKSANKLGELKNLAINTCRTLRANGEKPNKDHVIKREVEAHAYLDVSTTATGFSEKLAERHVMAG